ncbi:hypothetical protein NIES4103_53020 [Nostoc sp. NIES-4103]|nr:hypothetical protein NIES4103_53020 [Nostoc sp. NIES-4103]
MTEAIFNYPLFSIPAETFKYLSQVNFNPNFICSLANETSSLLVERYTVSGSISA